MKKAIACVLAVVMLLALMAGCGGSKVDLSGKYTATACANDADGT